MSLKERFERFVGRSGGYRDVDIQSTDGNYLVSADGDRYIDFVAGWCVVNAGYGRTEILEAAQNELERAAYVKPTYMNEAVTDLAEKLADITPGDLSHVFRTTSGTEAVENAIKAARAYTGRREIVANENSYHGHAYGSMALGSPDDAFQPVMGNATKIQPPTEMAHDEWMERFKQVLEQNDVAAYVTETVLTHQGVHMLHDGHYRDVKRVCEEHDVLLILDEVANGFGRTGELLAVDNYGVTPDIMTFAKGFSSGYAPIGAAIMTQDVGQELSEHSGTYATFGWTPGAVGATRKNIELIKEEGLPQRAHKTGASLAEQVRDIDGVTDVRQHGLLVGVEFGDDIASEVREAGVEHGVFTGTTNVDNVLLLSPPLNITEDYVTEGVERLEEAIRSVT